MSVKEKMTAIADPLREISGTSVLMSLDDMATRAQEAADETDTQADLISQIVVALSGKGTSEEGGNVLLQSKTAEPSESAQKIEADTGYDGLSSVTIGAVSRTYIGSGVTKKAAQTYTPGTTSQTIASGQYLSGTQTIKGDADLAPENIRVGVEIFGVSGTYAGEATTLQEKSVTPSKSEQSVTPDSGYDGMSKVTVNPIPYTETANDAGGLTVTIG